MHRKEMPIRDFILRKSCNTNGIVLPGKILFVVTLYGQLKLNIVRRDCVCHDYVDDLLLNGIFPSTPKRPSNTFNLDSGFDFELLDINHQLQVSCQIADNAFLKFISLKSDKLHCYVKKLVTNFSSISDRYRVIKHLNWHGEFKEKQTTLNITEVDNNFAKLDNKFAKLNETENLDLNDSKEVLKKKPVKVLSKTECIACFKNQEVLDAIKTEKETELDKKNELDLENELVKVYKINNSRLTIFKINQF